MLAVNTNWNIKCLNNEVLLNYCYSFSINLANNVHKILPNGIPKRLAVFRATYRLADMFKYAD